ncbi:hypothetical protein CARUB_v10021450mg [Capsella rubella]|uniref:Uncharacterized protein n=1 Tax=Capsella rubella TaxID=81985 RepID=R0I7B9_9BRAS|nr:hypothetical protein CARUB_v10021450mg [Capsella rubella]
MLARNLLCVSYVEHSFKSSYVLFVRAGYDHPLVKDFVKPVFMVESAIIPKVFSNFASFSRLSIPLENSWNTYLYFSCFILVPCCMNLLLLKL